MNVGPHTDKQWAKALASISNLSFGKAFRLSHLFLPSRVYKTPVFLQKNGLREKAHLIHLM